MIPPASSRKGLSFGQGGSSLAEAVLCLPPLVLFFMGIAQLLLIGWTLLLTHNAAQAAARSYTVFLGHDEDQARKRATRAAAAILARVRPAPAWDLELEPLTASEALASDQHGGEPSEEPEKSGDEEAAGFVEARLVVRPKLIFPLVRRLFEDERGGLTLHGRALAHSEATKDRAREREYEAKAEDE